MPLIDRLIKARRRLPLAFSRSRWLVRLLNMDRCSGSGFERGLVLIQIDGLSQTQFRRALSRGRLPFIRSLLSNRGFTSRPFYSGQPSTTPAVQGELFYGVKAAVPAFEFMHRKTGKHHAMFYPESANAVARRLSEHGKGLLEGGAAYSTIFSGGAKTARYCSETMDLPSLLAALNPVKLMVVLLIHITKLIRILAYGALELILAFSDFLGGVAGGRKVVSELKFVPSRVLMCVILRELVRFRVKMDVTRGVPIVAANFLGYDEQSHRRGPASAFAHWTLKGIDETVKDIYRSASRSDCRDYRLVVFSDHGQESVDSYADRFGKPLKQAVREVLSGTEGPGGGLSLHSANSDAHRENACRGTGHLFLGHRPITGKKRQRSGRERTAQIRITTMGPLGHIYLGQTTSGDPKGTPAFPTGAAGALYDLDHLACLLVEKARIPLVLYRREKSVSARTDAGRFDLIEGRAAVLGSDHPFLDQVAVDLRDLCLHTDAGDLVICGYRPETASTSFSVENGAHGGPGREETRGFVLLPPSFREDREFMRPMDLRQRIFAYLSGRNPHRVRTMPRTAPKRSETARQRLRVMTYNIHSCIHMDGRINPGRTAELIETLDPDVVALQEVDVYRARTGFTHQGEYLAEHLGMTCHFLPLLEKAGERYGLAMLSRFPATSLRNIHFPPERKELRREARGAQLAELDTPLGPVRLLNTHLGLTRGERHRQVRALFEDRWFAQALKLNLPLVVCGDFNAGPRSFVYKRLNEHVTDIQLQAARPGYPKATFFSRYPLLRLDHIFVSRQIRAERVVVPNGYEAKMVSDHLPLYGELVPV